MAAPMCTLEEAAKILLAPPEEVTPQQRKSAEEVFLLFRKTKSPYELCRQVLEQSSNSYVQFQAAVAIKESIVREWQLLKLEDIGALRAFLLQHVAQNKGLENYVKESILQTVAVIFKRGAIDSSFSDQNSIFNDVTKLLQSNEVETQLIACSILMALLNEYSTSKDSSRIGLNWEFHLRCKMQFEQNELKQVLAFCLQVLSQLYQLTQPFGRETLVLLNRFLSITALILSWGFSSKHSIYRRIGSSYGIEPVVLRPPQSWRDLLLDKKFVQLLFQIHCSIRENSELSHQSLLCLSQLASLSGLIFPNSKAEATYLKQFLEPMLEFSSIPLHRHEIFGVSEILHNLVIFFPMKIFKEIPDNQLESFLKNISHLACDICSKIGEDQSDFEDDFKNEAFEKLLTAWLDIVLHIEHSQFILSCSQRIFMVYLQTHLAAPDGTRKRINCDEEFDEVEEDDSLQFSTQLISIGILGRHNASESVPLLSELLESRVSRLHLQLQRLQQSGLDFSCPDAILVDVHEDIHWILLIVGHVIADGQEGEVPVIPNELVSLCLIQFSRIDMNTTLHVLSSPSQEIASNDSTLMQTDSLVRLVSAVFRLCEVENRAYEAGLGPMLSPQVALSNIWCLTRWLPAYLLPDCDMYPNPLCTTLLTVFTGDGATWIIGFLLKKIESNMNVWNSQADITFQTAKLLYSLVAKKRRSSLVVNCPLFWKIAEEVGANAPPYDKLSTLTKRKLYQSFVMAGSADFSSSSRESFWDLILSRLLSQFEHLSQQSKSSLLTQGTRNLVVQLLEIACGVAEAPHIDTVAVVFGMLQKISGVIVSISDIYHGFNEIVKLVLEYFSLLSENYLSYLEADQSEDLFKDSLMLMEIYAKHNTGRSFIVEGGQEDQFQDLLLIMSLLRNLLGKEFIDFSESGLKQPTQAVDVVLFGFSFIIPIMTAEMLKIPSLCHTYFRLTCDIVETCTIKFLLLPSNLQLSVLSSVELGLTNFDDESCRLSLECVIHISTTLNTAPSCEAMHHEKMDRFLQVAFNLLRGDAFNMDLSDTLGVALFCLICCRPASYHSLVNSVLEEQMDAKIKQSLTESFNNLTPVELPLQINRKSKLAFLEKFGTFFVTCRGFLCIR